MYDHHIVAMAEELVKSGLVTSQFGAEKVLSQYWDDKIADVWVTADILAMLEGGDLEGRVTEDDAIEILQIAHHNFDASIGINWDVLYMHTIDYLKERE